MKKTEKIIIILLIIYILINVGIFIKRGDYKQIYNNSSQDSEVISEEENNEDSQEDTQKDFNEEEILKNINNGVYVRYTVVNGFSMTGYKLIIKENGDVILLNNGRSLLKQEGISNSVIGVKHLKNSVFYDLRNTIDNTSVFNMENEYICRELCPTDLDSSTIEFYKNGNVKKISMYFPQDLPDGLSKIIQKLRNIKAGFNE